MTEATVHSEGEPTGQPMVDYKFQVHLDVDLSQHWEQTRTISSDEGREAARAFAKKVFLEDALKAFDVQAAKVRALITDKMVVL